MASLFIVSRKIEKLFCILLAFCLQRRLLEGEIFMIIISAGISIGVFVCTAGVLRANPRRGVRTGETSRVSNKSRVAEKFVAHDWTDQRLIPCRGVRVWDTFAAKLSRLRVILAVIYRAREESLTIENFVGLTLVQGKKHDDAPPCVFGDGVI